MIRRMETRTDEFVITSSWTPWCVLNALDEDTLGSANGQAVGSSQYGMDEFCDAFCRLIPPAHVPGQASNTRPSELKYIDILNVVRAIKLDVIGSYKPNAGFIHHHTHWGLLEFEAYS